MLLPRLDERDSAGERDQLSDVGLAAALGSTTQLLGPAAGRPRMPPDPVCFADSSKSPL